MKHWVELNWNGISPIEDIYFSAILGPLNCEKWRDKFPGIRIIFKEKKNQIGNLWESLKKQRRNKKKLSYGGLQQAKTIYPSSCKTCLEEFLLFFNFILQLDIFLNSFAADLMIISGYIILKYSWKVKKEF